MHCNLRTWIVAFVAFPFLLLLSVPVVVARVPMRVHLHVSLALLPRLFVILGLLLSGQPMPLHKYKMLIKCTGRKKIVIIIIITYNKIIFASEEGFLLYPEKFLHYNDPDYDPAVHKIH